MAEAAIRNASLTFLGDLTCPHGLSPRIEGPEPPSDVKVVNLEGALASPERIRARKGPRPLLYNSLELLPTLRRWNVRLASLANNHILDAGLPPSATAARLREAGIAACGAGDTWSRAAEPARLEHGGEEILFLAFGWEVIDCVAAGASRPGVSPLRPGHVLASVRSARARAPDARLVALMHWNYELEIHPMPAHRQLAFDAIDAGADLVVGHHPHCVQGIEHYRGRPVAYSLGNWFLPHGDWFGRPIHYPPHAARQLALEWLPASGALRCHWYDYHPDGHVVRFVASEDAEGSERVRRLSPFAGMERARYVEWFRRNRAKRRALPIYRDHRQERLNAVYDAWVGLRGRAVRGLHALRLR